MTVIDTYDANLKAAQREAAISKQECAELKSTIVEMEKKMAVLHDNYEQQVDKLEILQRKGIHETTCNYYTVVYLVIKHVELRNIVWHLIIQ